MEPKITHFRCLVADASLRDIDKLEARHSSTRISGSRGASSLSISRRLASADLADKVRILHVSDLHLLPHLSSIPLSDWLGKRVTGAINFLFQRRGQFASVPIKLDKLAEFAREQTVDAVLCTGTLSSGA